jgi:hypothetical protein
VPLDRARAEEQLGTDLPADRPATAGLSPFADVPSAYRVCMVAAFLLGTIARDALGDPDAARALRHPTIGATLISEIASELYLSVNTVKTHQRHLYQSSARAAGPRPSSRPAPSASLHHPRAGVEQAGGFAQSA